MNNRPDITEMLMEKRDLAYQIEELSQNHASYLENEDVDGFTESLQQREELLEKMRVLESKLPPLAEIAAIPGCASIVLETNLCIKRIQKLDALMEQKAQELLDQWRMQIQKISQGRRAGSAYDSQAAPSALYFDKRE